MPKWDLFQLYLQIDDGIILKVPSISFKQSYGPIIKYFRPAAASPAKAAKTPDFAGEFYSEWFDTDTNS